MAHNADAADVVVGELIEWDAFRIPDIPDMGRVMGDLDFVAQAMVILAEAGITFEEVM